MSRRERKSKSAKKAIQPVFRIYTEGEATEIHYIEAYVQDYIKSKGYFGPRIKVRQPKKYKPKDLLEAALAEKREGGSEDDEFWLVFDCDEHPDKDKVFQQATANEIQIAYSSFCFEEWLLLHYGYTTAPYISCASIVRQLEKHLGTSYSKAQINLFDAVSGTNHGNVASARQNAERLCHTMRALNPDKAIYEINPYTDVYKLLNAVDAFIEKAAPACNAR